MVTVQIVPETVSHPLQPLKMLGRFAVTVRFTTLSRLNKAEQLAPQSMPPGLEVTVPLPTPVRLALLTVRSTITVKLLALVAVPPGVVTLSGPVVALAGTVAWIAVAEVTEKLALTPLNVTAVAPVKFVPLSVTLVPTGPLVGGGGITVKVLALVAVPPGVVTLSGPVVAPGGTVA